VTNGMSPRGSKVCEWQVLVIPFVLAGGSDLALTTEGFGTAKAFRQSILTTLTNGRTQ